MSLCANFFAILLPRIFYSLLRSRLDLFGLSRLRLHLQYSYYSLPQAFRYLKLQNLPLLRLLKLCNFWRRCGRYNSTGIITRLQTFKERARSSMSVDLHTLVPNLWGSRAMLGCGCRRSLACLYSLPVQFRVWFKFMETAAASFRFDTCLLVLDVRLGIVRETR